MIWNQITQTKLQISQNKLMEPNFIPQSSSKREHPRISCCSVHNSGSDWIGLWSALHWGFTTVIRMVRVRERCARSSDGLWALFHALFVWCFPFTDNVRNLDLFSQCHTWSGTILVTFGCLEVSLLSKLCIVISVVSPGWPPVVKNGFPHTGFVICWESRKVQSYHSLPYSCPCGRLSTCLCSRQCHKKVLLYRDLNSKMPVYS